MPHQCTNCKRSFPDGSKQMLSGCPECGGKKFQFIPSGKTESREESTTDRTADHSPDTDHTTVGSDDGQTRPDEPAESTSSVPTPDDDGIIEAPDDQREQPPDSEDLAQADARRTVVNDDELPDYDDKTVVDIPDAEEPSLSDLRAELNNQFESIKVLEPGQYELNLMELYDRPEHIIAIEEDGRYVIDVADVGDRDIDTS